MKQEIYWMIYVAALGDVVLVNALREQFEFENGAMTEATHSRFDRVINEIIREIRAKGGD